MGKEVFSKAIEEELLVQLMGRRGFSATLYHKMLADTHKKTTAGIATSSSTTITPTAREMKEFKGLLVLLINLLQCQVRSGW